MCTGDNNEISSHGCTVIKREETAKEQTAVDEDYDHSFATYDEIEDDEFDNALSKVSFVLGFW